MSIDGEKGKGLRAEGRGDADLPRPSARGPLPSARKRTYAAFAFVTLLLLSVFWPSPVVSINQLWLHEELDVDHLSFLGREAPAWDVVFWFFAGLLLLIILQSAESRDFREPLRVVRAVRFQRALLRPVLVLLILGAIFTFTIWRVVDVPLLAWAEGVQSDALEDVIRLVNRFGGGMNPVLVVAFFLVCGVAYRQRRWIGYAVAMAISGLTAGLLAQIVKHLVGRARPELWLGPAHYAPGSSTSFPSGHTVGAFALAGVLVFASRSRPLRLIAFLLALAIGLSRIFAFRHWGSDVAASMSLGLAAAWLATALVMPLTDDRDRRP